MGFGEWRELLEGGQHPAIAIGVGDDGRAIPPRHFLRITDSSAGLTRLYRHHVDVVDVGVQRRRSSSGRCRIAFPNQHHDRVAVAHFSVANLAVGIGQHHAPCETEGSLEKVHRRADIGHCEVGIDRMHPWCETAGCIRRGTGYRADGKRRSSFHRPGNGRSAWLF
jgi:hypothetical protein